MVYKSSGSGSRSFESRGWQDASRPSVMTETVLGSKGEIHELDAVVWRVTKIVKARKLVFEKRLRALGFSCLEGKRSAWNTQQHCILPMWKVNIHDTKHKEKRQWAAICLHREIFLALKLKLLSQNFIFLLNHDLFFVCFAVPN